jgi:L-lactate utilization protein LutB
MGFFDRIFGKKIESDENTSAPKESDSESLPVDELFLREFTKSGGKFLYCENQEEADRFFDNIIEENSWQENDILCLDAELIDRYTSIAHFTDRYSKPTIFTTKCEHLIANQGSVLVCSKQLKGIKSEQLPENLIVFARTSQMVTSISEALRSIKQRHLGGPLPTKITSFKNNEVNQENKDDFMHYGTKTKNLYLLLLEDF